MKIENNLSRWAAVAVLAALLPTIMGKLEENTAKKRVPKQIHTKASVIDSDEDHKAAETGFGAAGVGGHGKYFQDIYVKQTGPMQLEFGHVCENDDEWEQRFERKDLAKNQHQGQHNLKNGHITQQCKKYQHNPEHDHYEFGYRRGNDHHFQERYEKAAPHAGHFKTKVRWGDKHGGYGEHYYDYNHDGHGGEGGGGGGDGGNDGGYSEPIPEYKPLNGKSKRQSVKGESDSTDQSPSPSQKTQKRAARTPVDVSELVFDVASGLVINEKTGQAFNLEPIN